MHAPRRCRRFATVPRALAPGPLRTRPPAVAGLPLLDVSGGLWGRWKHGLEVLWVGDAGGVVEKGATVGSVCRVWRLGAAGDVCVLDAVCS